MRKIWFVMVLSSLIALCFIDPENSITSMMNAGSNAITLSIKLVGIYAIWLGIISLVEKTGLNNIIASLMSPVIDFLFGKVETQTKNYIALNLSANMLGMGNACTPMGIKAMQGLDRVNNSKLASTSMIMLLVINATSIQILPTTIMGMRVSFGSTNSTDIIIPTLIATFVSTFVGIFLVKICAVFRKKIRKNTK